MINVLVLIDAWFPFVGGAQIQIKNLKKMLEKDYDVKYYIFHSPSANIIIRFLWSLWVIPQAFFLNKKHKFNLIHAHAYWSGIPGKILSSLLKIPVIFTVHGSNLLDLNKKSLRFWLEKFILTKIKYSRVISVSSNFKKYKNINKNISIIHNGVSIDEFNGVKINKAKPYKIIYVGRNDPIKGLKYLKKAMKEVEKVIPETRLKVINKGYNYKRLIKEYKSSHIFVLPSLSEGQPLTLLEAWAAKLPVVVTDVGDNSKFVKDGINGYLTKPGNSNDLVEKIIKVIKNKDRKKMGEAGFTLINQKYSWKICANETYKVYKQTLKS